MKDLMIGIGVGAVTSFAAYGLLTFILVMFLGMHIQ